MRPGIHPRDMDQPVIELDCVACGRCRRMTQTEVIRETACYIALDVALFMLAKGCLGRDGQCELRFSNVSGAEGARSIVNRRGRGWTRRRAWNGATGCDVYWDGWQVGAGPPDTARAKRRPVGLEHRDPSSPDRRWKTISTEPWQA